MKIKTMLAVIAGALGLAATADVALPTGTSFEGNDAGPVAASAIVDEGATWSTTDADAALEVKVYDSDSYLYDSEAGNGRIAKWGDIQDKYLSVKTAFGKPLTRAMSIPMNGSSVYFDSLIKFTACDEEPTAYTGAKLVVYALEDEDGGTTDIKVMAGNGTFVIKSEVTDLDNWHRLTIKSFKAATVVNSNEIPGFAIFIDGAPVSAADYVLPEGTLDQTAAVFAENRNLFTSLDTESADWQTFTGVGFDGQGAIDDVAFTSVAPVTEAEDPSFSTITIGEKVDSFVVNGKTYTADAVITATDTVTIENIVYKSGFFGPATASVEPGATTDLSAGAKDIVAKIGEANYESIEAALTAAVANVTIVLQKNVEAKAAIEVTKAVTIDLNGKTVTGATDCNVFEVAGAAKFVDSVGTGTVVAMGSEEGDGGFAIYDESTEGTVVSVESGTYAGSGDEVDVVSENATLAITGGWFKNDPSDYVADGYETTVDATHDNYYKVVEWTPKSWDDVLGEPVGGAYQIDDKADLTALATYAGKTGFGTAGVTFEQTANIDLDGDEWAGIGEANNKDNLGTEATFKAKAFQGVFDGQNHTISGIELERADYAGFFGSAHGATIKNTKFAVKEGGTGFAAEGGTGDFCGALICGVSVKTTIENCETLAGSFTAQKASAGIVGYAAGGTVIKDCVNRLNVTSLGNEKVAGLVGCAQNTGSYSPACVTIDGCTNYGNVECKASGKSRAALLVSYTDCEVKFQGNITAQGTVTQAGSTVNIQSIININGGSATVVEGAVITASAGMKSTIHNGKAHAGLNYATVANGVATFVADSAAANGANLKVMTTGNTITLANVGDTITLDTTLATATVNTTATDAYVKQEGNVYTVMAKQPVDFTVTVDPTEAEWKEDLEFPTPTITGTSATGSWSPAAITAPEAGTTNTYTYTVTVAATDTTLETTKTATFKVWKAAPAADLPSDVAGGSDKQKADYADWATKAGVTGTGNENAAAFALEVTAAEIQAAAGDVTKAVQAKLDAEITSEMVAALVAGTDGQGLADLKAKYPNADFEFVPATELTSTDTAKFFKLQVSFKPANAQK